MPQPPLTLPAAAVCLTVDCLARQGGSTAFVKLGVEVQAKKRRIAVFHNCLPGKTDNVNPMTMHCGSPNEGAAPKWAANKWIRQFPMHPERPRRAGPPPEWASPAPQVPGWRGQQLDGIPEPEPAA